MYSGDAMYTSIIDFFANNKLVCLYISVPLLLLHLLNCFFERKHSKKRREEKENKKGKSNNISIYLVIITIGTLLVLTNIPVLKHIIIFLNSILLFYILIIVPLFNKDVYYDYIESSTIISSIFITNICYLLVIIKPDLFTNISNNSLEQIFKILLIFILLFLITYVILINLRLIFYYSSNGFIKVFDENLNFIMKAINKKYNSKTFNKKLKTKKTKLSLFFEATKQLILFTTFVIVINSLIFVIHFFVNIFIKEFSSINNSYIYSISKITLISTILIIYLIIQTSSDFSEKLITSYEFLSSTIIIPLLLEGLLKGREKIQNKSML